ncbi:hypothetical protein EIP91_006834 [Steccherinum ochraceum]|uniref:Protein kinase domain-containing protein n=1 Tax=Steccherinum ochraceum TaxID=92696 RepID=A0A4R0RJJ3_9APHY|nr:hypothetical protein EIP91_006834 [Steccherinum ochraceum]
MARLASAPGSAIVTTSSSQQLSTSASTSSSATVTPLSGSISTLRDLGGHSPPKAGFRGRTTSHGMDRSSPSRSPHSRSSHERSRSPLRDVSTALSRLGLGSASPGRDTPPNEPPSTWWGAKDKTRGKVRPWHDTASLTHEVDDDDRGWGWGNEERAIAMLRKESIPEEQSEGWVRTREKVDGALTAVLGPNYRATVGAVVSTGLDATREVLAVGADLLELAPIPGLAIAARVLVGIWDAVQMVDLNRLACLRLTERCATILMSIRDEIVEASAGQAAPYQVGSEMESALRRLVDVHHLVIKIAHRPFLKRYLKRDEMAREIIECDARLGDAMSVFGISIQIRVLKQVLKAEEQRRADTNIILDKLLREAHSDGRLPAGILGPDSIGIGEAATSTTLLDPSSIAAGKIPEALVPTNALHLAGTESQAVRPTVTSLPPLPATQPAEAASALYKDASPLSVLNDVLALQNERDTQYDVADLRQLMRRALSTSNDVDMIRVLQVSRDEMPEALKTLQRALEKVVEQESLEQPEVADVPKPAGPGAELSRSSTIISTHSTSTDRSRTTTTTTTSSKSRSRSSRDTLDREFLESGIESLRRISVSLSASSAPPPSLPSWTITRYEVDRETKIGIGFFSDVYRGRWRGRQVAIKVLAETTPRRLFKHEVGIWKTLNHPNVLELLGASSTVGDPPWFLVSPYLKNGSLVGYLKATHGEVDLLKMVHEIAKGMTYLHGKGVLHGDLKGANVLVDDRGHCVISDFGQSEMKNEVYRVSGTPLPHGTLRWQSPELMAGHSNLTQEADVYAFAICCVEVLTKGALPWPMADDNAVRHFVLSQNRRPDLPLTRSWSPQLAIIVNSCWDRDPDARPPFMQIEVDLHSLRKGSGSDIRESPLPPPPSELLDTRKSPDMHPVPLPLLPPDTTAVQMDVLGESIQTIAIADVDHLRTPMPHSATLPRPTVHIPHSPHQSRLASPVDDHKAAIPSPFGSPVASHHHGHPDDSPIAHPSRASSMFVSTTTETSQSDYEILHEDLEGYESPPPADDRIAEIKNERRYRMLLQHEFHPSLTLPLWSPSFVALGAVGYHNRPTGSFVTLFNSLKPLETSTGVAKDIPSLYGYGKVSQGSQRLDKRNIAQRGLDMVQSWITSKKTSDGSSPASFSRRYSSPLRNGHKTAHLFTESTVYRYVEDLTTPKTWFKANVDHILALYGKEHAIQKEDLYLVIGTLDAADYALFVSHNHPDGQVNFNVSSSARAGQEWGRFTTSTDLSASIVGGPVYVEEAPGYSSVSKISTVKTSGKWDTVLLARLRFPPDRTEPTSL